MDASRNTVWVVGGLVAVALAVAAFAVVGSLSKRAEPGGALPAPPPAPTVPAGSALSEPGNGKHVVTIKTNFGTIQFATYDADAPNTTQNFLKLAEQGFYTNLTFHRVINGFMIQGGDPRCSPAGRARDPGSCGSGGPGYLFADELNPETKSYQEGYARGVVAMANAGPNTNGSQFFIMLKDTPLPKNYTIFGRVIEGQEVVDAIGETETGEGDRPLAPVVMEQVTVAPVGNE